MKDEKSNAAENAQVFKKCDKGKHKLIVLCDNKTCTVKVCTVCDEIVGIKKKKS